MTALALAHLVGAGDVAAADGQRQNAIVTQLVLIAEILVSQRVDVRRKPPAVEARRHFAAAGL